MNPGRDNKRLLAVTREHRMQLFHNPVLSRGLWVCSGCGLRNPAITSEGDGSLCPALVGQPRAEA